MGRPSKKYVDYFPHDTDASERRTLFVIESNYGNNGYAFWFKLLEVLGRKDGHFLDLNDDNELIFLSAKTRLSTEETKLILDLLAKLGAIDRELWAKRIVWSQNFVDRITDVYRIRKKKPPSKLDIMGADFDPFINGVSTAETPVSTESIGFIPQKSAETPVSTAESTQSKLKENRLKENKETLVQMAKLFARFWVEYPKKRAKKAAFKAFQKIKDVDLIFEKILSAVQLQSKTDDWTKESGRYVPYPATWLNNERWKDEAEKITMGW